MITSGVMTFDQFIEVPVDVFKKRFRFTLEKSEGKYACMRVHFFWIADVRNKDTGNVEPTVVDLKFKEFNTTCGDYAPFEISQTPSPLPGHKYTLNVKYGLLTLSDQFPTMDNIKGVDAIFKKPADIILAKQLTAVHRIMKAVIFDTISWAGCRQDSVTFFAGTPYEILMKKSATEGVTRGLFQINTTANVRGSGPLNGEISLWTKKISAKNFTIIDSGIAYSLLSSVCDEFLKTCDSHDIVRSVLKHHPGAKDVQPYFSAYRPLVDFRTVQVPTNTVCSVYVNKNNLQELRSRSLSYVNDESIVSTEEYNGNTIHTLRPWNVFGNPADPKGKQSASKCDLVYQPEIFFGAKAVFRTCISSITFKGWIDTTLGNRVPDEVKDMMAEESNSGAEYLTSE
jgi:hypothetical protein